MPAGAAPWSNFSQASRVGSSERGREARHCAERRRAPEVESGERSARERSAQSGASAASGMQSWSLLRIFRDSFGSLRAGALVALCLRRRARERERLLLHVLTGSGLTIQTPLQKLPFQGRGLAHGLSAIEKKSRVAADTTPKGLRSTRKSPAVAPRTAHA